MARKSFQKGTVIERRYEYRTTYIARWREKNPEGRWREKSKTLRDCLDKKTAQKELDRILREINRQNGVAAYRANVRFNDLLGKHWPNYLKSADVNLPLRQHGSLPQGIGLSLSLAKCFSLTLVQRKLEISWLTWQQVTSHLNIVKTCTTSST